MIHKEEKYLKVTDWTWSEEFEKTLFQSLAEEHLQTVITTSSDEEHIISLAKSFEAQFGASNGLLVFYDSRVADEVINAGAYDCVISLPTQHEAIEAIMMNILENEFLNSGE